MIDDLRAREQDVGVDLVVVVTLRQGRIVGPVGHRRALAAEVGDVGDGPALLEQELAAGEILHPRLAHFPPGVGALKVDAPFPHGHAGIVVRPGLVSEPVKNEAVDSTAKSTVAVGLERVGIIHPAGELGKAGETFGGDDVLAVNVADGGSHFYRPAVGLVDVLSGPEFAHGDVVVGAGLERFERALVGLDHRLEPVRVAGKSGGVNFGADGSCA